MPNWATRSPTTPPRAASSSAGLAVITGTEDRQHAYVALTGGTDVNTAYVFTLPPRRADPTPGPRPAPELARHNRLAAAPSGQPAPASTPGEALAVLAGVLDRDGQQHSATQVRNQALADADRHNLMIPSEDPDYGDLGQAFPAWTGPGRDAILQPPNPEITPSPQILQRVMDRDAEWEAAD